MAQSSKNSPSARSARNSFWSAVRRVRSKLYQQSYEPSGATQQLRKTFATLGFDYDEALALLNSRLRPAGLPDYDEERGMCSQHWVLFAALAGAGPSRLLEIGTYDATFTRVLAAIFPTTEIVTCDLPEESSLFVGSYGRADDQRRREFLDRRQRNLESLTNVRFIAANSFLLPSLVTEKFDVVWVDGGHDFPEVAWDACNAFHMSNDEAYIVFDDLYAHPAARRGQLSPDFNDSARLLRGLAAEQIYDVTYIPKRVLPRYAADPVLRKHVAVARKRKVSAIARE